MNMTVTRRGRNPLSKPLSSDRCGRQSLPRVEFLDDLPRLDEALQSALAESVDPADSGLLQECQFFGVPEPAALKLLLVRKLRQANAVARAMRGS